VPSWHCRRPERRPRQFNAPEELSGIRETIENYTNAYLEPDIVEAFSSASPTVGIDALEEGKVLLISIPQQFTRAQVHPCRHDGS
jgi:hypothetical protein